MKRVAQFVHVLFATECVTDDNNNKIIIVKVFIFDTHYSVYVHRDRERRVEVDATTVYIVPLYLPSIKNSFLFLMLKSIFTVLIFTVRVLIESTDGRCFSAKFAFSQ